jgi:integrase
VASISKRPSGAWLARYRPVPGGPQITKTFKRQRDARRWLNEQTAALVTGTHVHPRTARTTVADWCDTWLQGYGTRRASTVRQAEVHIKQIKAAFGPIPLADLRPSHVKAWTAKLKADGAADSYVYALHARLGQVLGDAVHDGIVPRSPVSRRTSPGAGKQRPYVATTEQVWALHDAVPEHLRVAVLLGAFVGLRTAEVVALRTDDVDFMRGVVTPAVQWGDLEVKTATSRTPVPIPQELALRLSASVAAFPSRSGRIVTNGTGGEAGPWVIDRAVRASRTAAGLPDGFRFHDLRHYLASLLIASGADVKVVQSRLRHASATTTLNTYAHMWPDSDESTRSAVAAVLRAEDSLRTETAR